MSKDKFDHKSIEADVLAMPNTRLDYPFGEDAAVYKTDKDKMFAIIAEGSDPLTISLKCDPELSKVLKEKYDSVMPGYHLNKKHWITIVLSGQLSRSEVKDLIKHSYSLVNES
ncbi:MAG TPA: MmcQ/YjbR family DNA-binding protein [Candidatus Saccharimonadales bacterium]|nr:MmcQ/YjbR family DNA-binding protein [Candidatus Saccharimonadales bacterium]